MQVLSLIEDKAAYETAAKVDILKWSLIWFALLSPVSFYAKTIMWLVSFITNIAYMVIMHFLSLVLVSCTVFHLTSNLHRQLTFSKLVLKRFSFITLFLIILTNCKVPVQCLWHFGHYNRFFFIFIINASYLLFELILRLLTVPWK